MTWPLRASILALLLLPFCALAQSLPELTAELPVSPEHPVPTDLSPSGFASSGSHSLVLFDRFGDVHAGILDPDGTTRKMVPIARSGRYEHGLTAFWNGEKYVVLCMAGATAFSIRVSPEGVVDEPRMLAASYESWSFRAFGDGDSILLLWNQGTAGESVLMALILDRNGEPAGDSWVLFDEPLIVHSGSASAGEYFVAASRIGVDSDRTLLAGPLIDGRPWQPYTVPEVSFAQNPDAQPAERLIRTRNGYLLVWAVLPKYFGRDLRAIVLTETEPGPSWSFGIQPWGAPSVQQFPGGTMIAFASRDGYPYGHYSAAIFDENAVGSTLSPFPISESGFFTGPAPHLTWDGHRVGAVWPQRSMEKPPVSQLVYVDPSTQSTTPAKTVGLLPEHEQKSIVATGTNVDLVAWQSPHQFFASTYSAVRVDKTGQPIDAASFALDVKPSAIASDSAIFLVVGVDGRGAHAQRVGESGVVFKETPFQLAGYGTREAAGASVVWTGEHFLVAWTEGAPDSNPAVRAARVLADGTLLDPEGFELLPGLPASHARLAFDGTNALVVWVTPGREIQSMLVSPDGAPRSTVSHVGWDVETRDPLHDYETVISPSVAFNGASYLVTWKTPAGELWGSGVSKNGFVDLAPPPNRRRPARIGDSSIDRGEVLIATHVGLGHSVVGIDGGWMVAWDTGGRGDETDVLWRRVASDRSLSPVAVIAANSDVAERAPAMTVCDGVVTIVYERAGRIVMRKGTAARTDRAPLRTTQPRSLLRD